MRALGRPPPNIRIRHIFATAENPPEKIWPP